MPIIKFLKEEILKLKEELKSLSESNIFLRAENDGLKQEIIELKRRLNQDSSNSSKPPSSDPLWKRKERKPKGKRKSSGRKPGGQKGHTGHKLKKFDKVDFHETHQLACCPICESENLQMCEVITRQVVDIPKPKVEVTEHELWNYNCGDCGNKVSGGAELKLSQEVQYGPRIKSLVSYLSVYQLIPYKRLTELILHLFGIAISQGSISNFNKELSKNLIGFKEALKNYFIEKQGVFHSDETGCIVDQFLNWVHVYSDLTKTFLAGHQNRGRKAIDDIGILSKSIGTLIHDRFGSYNSSTNVKHGLCNSHILRDLESIIDIDQLDWPRQIAKILLAAKGKKDEKELTKWQVTYYVNKYDDILKSQKKYYQIKEDKRDKSIRKRGKPKRSKDHNLYIALWKRREEVLRFIKDPEVPFDNNQAERDFRMLKVKMKISNLFKSLDWLNVHLDIRSYISTVMKQRMDVLNAIQNTYENPDFASKVAV